MYDNQLKQVSNLQASMDFSYIDETISMLRQFDDADTLGNSE